MKKMIVAALALGFVFATTAQAELAAFFDQGMSGSGFAVGSQYSQNNFAAGPLQYQGAQQGQICSFGGSAQTFNGTNVAGDWGGVALSQNNQAAVSASRYGYSSATVGNSGQLSFPNVGIFTDNMVQVETIGGSAQGFTSTTVVMQH